MVKILATLALEGHEQVLPVRVVLDARDIGAGPGRDWLECHARSIVEAVESDIPLLRDIRRQPASAGTGTGTGHPVVTLPRGDARERPLFSRAEVADLLQVPMLDVLKLAAVYDVGWTRSASADGPQFSANAVKQLLRASLAARRSGTGTEPLARFDRAALVWFMLEGDPTRVAAPPGYSARFEQELARVAKLEEPARSLRIVELQAAWKDARVIADSLQRAVL